MLRWAIRILGLPAPPETGENTYAAKQLVLGFIQEHLHIDNVVIDDIDCAHRVGRVVDFKQTLLVRFHARDLVQLILRNRTKLKGSQYVLFEDCTLKNRKLIRELKNHPKIDSAWSVNGTVWAKTEPNGRKIKFTLGDNLDIILANKPNRPVQPSPPRPDTNAAQR
jgi:hypothetical protein